MGCGAAIASEHYLYITTKTRDRTDRTDVQAAKKAGLGEKTYTKAKAVVEAAEANPDRFGDLPAKMDADNNVDGAYKAMQQRQTTDELGESPKKRAHEDPGGVGGASAVPCVCPCLTRQDGPG